MHHLYSLGYQGWQGPQFLETVTELGAVVGDIRFMPRSRLPFWNGGTLERTLGVTHYVKIPQLGNRNYKGGPVAFVDLAAGLQYVQHRLAQAPLILLCGCREVLTCHRYQVAQALETQHGLACIHLDPPARLIERDHGTADRPLPLMYLPPWA